MLTPYPPPSLLLLTSTTGRLMIASWATRRLAKQIMMNWAHAEALPNFYSARKWREIRQEGRSRINNADMAGRRRRIRWLEHGGAMREEAMQQPTSTREAQCKERDSGVTREGRGGMARFCTAQQKAMQHDSK